LLREAEVPVKSGGVVLVDDEAGHSEKKSGNCRKNSVNLNFEIRKVLGYRFPDCGNVDAEILMDQFVPHAGNILPGDVRVSFFQRRREIFRHFADDLDRRITPS
jgi:hypothetical protein